MFFLSRSRGFGETLRRMLRRINSHCVPILVGTLLLTAAALKAHQLATAPITEDSLFTSRCFLIALVEIELALGLWLLSGAYTKQVRYATLAAFLGFGLMSLHLALTGAPSCGCFGVLHVSPWHTLLFDLIAVAALSKWNHRRNNEHIWICRGGETPVHFLSAR